MSWFEWFWGFGRLIMSVVPWWVYATFTVAIYLTLRKYLGNSIAVWYLAFSVVFTVGDFLADDRERWIRAEWKAQAERAQQLAKQIDKEAAADDGADLKTQLAKEAALRREMQDAVIAMASRPGCGVDDVLDRLRPR